MHYTVLLQIIGWDYIGEYREPLLSGGELIVTDSSWCIKYYFPGPDLRYNGTFVTIDASKVDEYIAAW